VKILPKSIGKSVCIILPTADKSKELQNGKSILMTRNFGQKIDHIEMWHKSANQKHLREKPRLLTKFGEPK